VIGATGRVPTTRPGVTGRSAGHRCRAVRHGSSVASAAALARSPRKVRAVFESPAGRGGRHTLLCTLDGGLTQARNATRWTCYADGPPGGRDEGRGTRPDGAVSR